MLSSLTRLCLRCKGVPATRRHTPWCHSEETASSLFVRARPFLKIKMYIYRTEHSRCSIAPSALTFAPAGLCVLEKKSFTVGQPRSGINVQGIQAESSIPGLGHGGRHGTSPIAGDVWDPPCELHSKAFWGPPRRQPLCAGIPTCGPSRLLGPCSHLHFFVHFEDPQEGRGYVAPPTLPVLLFSFPLWGLLMPQEFCSQFSGMGYVAIIARLSHSRAPTMAAVMYPICPQEDLPTVTK